MLSWQLVLAILVASIWPVARILGALRSAAEIRQLRKDKRTVSVADAISRQASGQGVIAENHGDLLPGDWWYLPSEHWPDNDDLEWAMMESGLLIDPSSKEERLAIEKFRGLAEVMWITLRDPE